MAVADSEATKRLAELLAEGTCGRVRVMFGLSACAIGEGAGAGEDRRDGVVVQGATTGPSGAGCETLLRWRDAQGVRRVPGPIRVSPAPSVLPRRVGRP
jgi:hypothetical protein